MAKTEGLAIVASGSYKRFTLFALPSKELSRKLATKPNNDLQPSIHTGIMPVCGSRISLLIPSRIFSLCKTDPILPYHCKVHRTICHHARRPSLRIAMPSPAPNFTLQRGAKTRSTVKLKDLPQGALKLEPYHDTVEDAPRYPPVVQGHRNNMEKFQNCVILTRVGGFYEVRKRIRRTLLLAEVLSP